MNTIDTLYHAAQHTSERDSAWATLRAAEAATMPCCPNHPDRVAIGGWDTPLCLACIEERLPYLGLWLKSCGVVRGGVTALKGSHA